MLGTAEYFLSGGQTLKQTANDVILLLLLSRPARSPSGGELPPQVPSFPPIGIVRRPALLERQDLLYPRRAQLDQLVRRGELLPLRVVVVAVVVDVVAPPRGAAARIAPVEQHAHGIALPPPRLGDVAHLRPQEAVGGRDGDVHRRDARHDGDFFPTVLVVVVEVVEPAGNVRLEHGVVAVEQEEEVLRAAEAVAAPAATAALPGLAVVVVVWIAEGVVFVVVDRPIGFVVSERERHYC
mmetsp:Transcript_44055/g.93798  ORF Transcript_44055/g.93798 Transcript_44055/m.93798 type:complete len:239 (-) Transcript_44055:131-847(-)